MTEKLLKCFNIGIIIVLFCALVFITFCGVVVANYARELYISNQILQAEVIQQYNELSECQNKNN